MDTMAGTESKKRPRRRHTDEFRAGAVRLVLKEGRKVAQVARDLDIAVETGLWGGSGRADAVTERPISANDATRLAA